MGFNSAFKGLRCVWDVVLGPVTIVYDTVLKYVLGFKMRPHNITETAPWMYINLLKPTGHVMHHQFNIQQFYALPTLYLFVLYLSENKQ